MESPIYPAILDSQSQIGKEVVYSTLGVNDIVQWLEEI